MKKGLERKTAPAKRGRGRPVAAKGVLGRQTLVAAAREILNEMPPSKVTMAAVARRAGSDPAMVRYYFGDRETLLLAVVDDILLPTRPSLPTSAPPEDRIRYQIRSVVDFARNSRAMQRLMLDELANAKSLEIRQRVVALYARAAERYAQILDQTEAQPLTPVDPLFLFIALIGVSEFFTAAQGVIKPLRPTGESDHVLYERYKDFVTSMLVEGLRPR